ncbi:hypothetical protein SAMN05421823_110114 [Catalinimonas alkaloidigena]|uniref:AsmA-like C-terminal region n=1 Tax=Catalinimonas alkaloidigena TaxID=1075417 RepID=A0A1G9QBQ6_9BACT|nr:hypothetical protein [Catalinimonas alkaloidigena]SDM08456.1 hypothetical protein SAMN05421823_110114 [Catalinimonas alkaloidigena]
MKKVLIWLLSTAVILGILLTAVQVLSLYVVSPIVGRKLEQRVTEWTDSLYQLDVQNLRINLLGGTIRSSSILFGPDTSHIRQHHEQLLQQPNLFEVQLDGLNLEDIDVMRLLLKRELALDAIEIREPFVRVIRNELARTDTLAQDTAQTSRRDPLNVYQYFNGVLHTIELGELWLSEGTIVLEQWQHAENRAELPRFSLRIRDIKIDSTAHLDRDRMFYSEHFRGRAEGFRIETPDSLYVLSIDSVGIDSDGGRLSLDSLHYTPLFKRSEMGKMLEKRNASTEVSVARVDLKGVDLKRLFRLNDCYVNEVDLDQIRLLSYKNKKLYEEKRIRPLPQEILRELPIHVKIDSLKIKDGFIRYDELGEESIKPGYVTFERLNGVLRNLTNVPWMLDTGATATFDGSAYLMGQGRLDAHLKFMLGDSTDRFEVRGTLGKMDLTALNEMTVNRVFVRIKEGQNLRTDFHIVGNGERSGGELRWRYQDLKISVLNGDKVLEDEESRRDIISFLANRLVLRSDNPKGDDLRVGQIYFERNPQKSMFNYWWKSALSGMKHTLGVENPRPEEKTFWERVMNWFGAGSKQEE